MSVYDLTGRRALVTGGARGLGEGMARALARAGASVVIGDIREDLGKACADSLRSDGFSAEFVPLDITAEDSWAQAIPQAIAHLGGLDILVNNAGVEITSLLVDIDPAEVRRQLEVNVLGTALGLKHGFRAMRPGGPAGAGGSDRQRRLGRGDDRLPRHRDLLGHQVRGRPADQGRRDGVGQARLRGPGELRVPRSGADRDG